MVPADVGSCPAEDRAGLQAAITRGRETRIPCPPKPERVIMGDWFTENGRGQRLDVSALLDSECGDLLHGLVATGALVSIGLTSDGGALGVTVTVDGRWRRDYFRSSEDLGSWLEAALPAVTDAVALVDAARSSSAPRRRSRGL